MSSFRPKCDQFGVPCTCKVSGPAHLRKLRKELNIFLARTLKENVVCTEMMPYEEGTAKGFRGFWVLQWEVTGCESLTGREQFLHKAARKIGGVYRGYRGNKCCIYIKCRHLHAESSCKF